MPEKCCLVKGLGLGFMVDEGIVVAKDWLDKEWGSRIMVGECLLAMGYGPGSTIDRLRPHRIEAHGCMITKYITLITTLNRTKCQRAP